MVEEKNTALEIEVGSLRQTLGDQEEKSKVEIYGLRSEIKGLQDNLANTIGEMQTNHSQELEAVRQEHDKLIADLKNSHQSEMDNANMQVAHLNLYNQCLIRLVETSLLVLFLCHTDVYVVVHLLAPSGTTFLDRSCKSLARKTRGSWYRKR